MILIPYETSTYTTQLSKEAVHKRLAAIIRPKWSFTFSFWSDPDGKKYRGEINGDRFEIMRIVRGRNSFAPVISGDIREQPGGCTIEVNMRLHFLVMALMIFWCSMVGIGAVRASVSHSGAAFIPLSMMLIAYLITIIGFNIERSRSTNELKQILDAEITAAK